MKLGKKAAKLDDRRLMLGKYLTDGLRPTPPSYDWSGGIKHWGMMLNDRLGCCTISAVGHAIQVVTAARGSMLTVPDAVIESAYRHWDGYNPRDPASDQGGVEIDVLDKWRREGLAGHQLMAYADPAPGSIDHVQRSIVLFGGLYIGLALPRSAQKQDTWDAVDGPDGEIGSWGGHAVFVCGYDMDGLTCITWGAPKRMTWRFWLKYCDEAHAPLCADFLDAANVDPAGLDLVNLQKDLAIVAA